MDWKRKRVFVTGAGGFIASHLLETLIRLEARVKAFVRYNSKNDFGLIEQLPLQTRNKIEVIAGDLRDYDAVYDTMQNTDIVFHLAALISIPYSYVHPKEVIETNIMGTYNVLNAAKRLRIKKLIHTSTSEVYGSALKVPIVENHPLQGQSPYSASKIGADKIAESFYCSYGLPVVTIRPFNTFGPRQSARAVIPAIITQALQSNSIRLGSLFPKRDFTYVQDTVDAFIGAAESPKSIGETIHIGSGREVSIGELVRIIAKLLGKKITVITDKKRVRPHKSEVQRLIASTKKAKELLGWTPNIKLEDGLHKTIEWLKDSRSFVKSRTYIF